jgi:hypothetical protein
MLNLQRKPETVKKLAEDPVLDENAPEVEADEETAETGAVVGAETGTEETALIAEAGVEIALMTETGAETGTEEEGEGEIRTFLA